MSREQAFLRVLESSANLQSNMAQILEAKAVEAEKTRNWICNHVRSDAFASQQQLVKDTMEIHDQLIEVIDGLSKMGQGMCSMLKVVLRHDADGGDTMDGMGGLFGGGFDMEAGDK
ncbi:restriction endonuclease subunit S [Paenibacillus sp. 1P07SE]|uniref:restriction endonuclease subunit S n=1 Tax=Paenibacillus sp. 1P07SE TaxID=3132209 RepID=UPI0039A4E0F0